MVSSLQNHSKEYKIRISKTSESVVQEPQTIRLQFGQPSAGCVPVAAAAAAAAAAAPAAAKNTIR